MDISNILDTIKTLRAQMPHEATPAGKEALTHQVNDLLRQAGDIRAVQIDSTFWPGHSGNKPTTLTARREYIDGLRDAMNSPEFDKTETLNKK